MQEFFGKITGNLVSSVLMALAALAIWWFIGYLIEKGLKHFAYQRQLDTPLFFLSSIIRKATFGIGFIFAMGRLGFDISGILAGLGLTGFALSFAFKDALSNLIAGIFILFYRPFIAGDAIKIETNKSIHEGIVSSIDLRYTTIKNGNRTILIPNSFLLTEPLSIIHNA